MAACRCFRYIQWLVSENQLWISNVGRNFLVFILVTSFFFFVSTRSNLAFTFADCCYFHFNIYIYFCFAQYSFFFHLLPSPTIFSLPWGCCFRRKIAALRSSTTRSWCKRKSLLFSYVCGLQNNNATNQHLKILQQNI